MELDYNKSNGEPPFELNKISLPSRILLETLAGEAMLVRAKRHSFFQLRGAADIRERASEGESEAAIVAICYASK